MPTIDELASQVAALEQQMAAITTPPDKYYTSIYSGEEIDAAITKVRSGAMGVSSFNGRAGAVMPQAGDYNATQIPVSADTGAETVAAALANKAPAGYGLGVPAKVVDSANNCKLSGWYLTGANVPNAPDGEGGYWLIRVDSRDASILYQTAYANEVNSGVPNFVICRRYYVNSEWSPWEYITPPMQLGVEYRTAERYNGKPVYVMAVDGGAFPDNSSKTIEVQIPDASGKVKMLDCYGVLDNGTQIPGLLGIPTFSEVNYLGIFTQNRPGKFTISVGSGRTVGMNFTLFLKYWKE